MSAGMAFIRIPSIATDFVQAGENLDENLKHIKEFKGEDPTTYFTEGRWNKLRDMEAWQKITNVVEGRLGRNEKSRDVMASFRTMVKNMAYQKLSTGNFSESWFKTDRTDIVEQSAELLLQGLAGPGVPIQGIEFEGRAILPPPGYSLNAPRTALLEDLVRNPQFLRREIIPYARRNAHYSQIKDVSFEDALMRDLLNDNESWWDFTEEGIRPMVYYDEVGLSGPIFHKDTGHPLLFPYEDLPSLIINPQYNEMADANRGFPFRFPGL